MILKKYEKLSVVVTVLIGIAFLVGLGFLSYWLPVVVDNLIDVKDELGNRAEITDTGRFLVLFDSYMIVVVAVVAVVFLFILLRKVYKREVFSKIAARLISAISWCCFAEGLLFALLIVYFQLSVCVAAAACFLGLSLRVVMHVIEEATDIKSENDFTI